MIIILKQNPDPDQMRELTSRLREEGVTVQTGVGKFHIVLGLVGDTSHLDVGRITALGIVEEVHRIQPPYQYASRKFHPEDTVISVGNTRIGGDTLTLIAGPCTVESEDQMVSIAKAVKKSGASLLRGGAFKPRSSPYSFQGLGERGLEYLKTAKRETGLPIITELMDAEQLPLFRDVDVLQIGARNMQNYELLKAVGQQDKPVMLKRGISATYEEWLMSAEYILAGGNPNVILCERGIRTFEPYTRYTLDLSAVSALHRLTHLPVVVDPSHATGKSWMVKSMSAAAVAAGCDGVMIEVHNAPASALCDGAQSIKPEAFDDLANQLFSLHKLMHTAD